MDSPRNNMRACPTDNVDTSIIRRFRFWKFQESRRFEFRADLFNVLNIVQFNARSSSVTFNTPSAMAVQNSEYNADGSVASGCQLPKNTGFGAATGAAAMRSIQLQLRFSF